MNTEDSVMNAHKQATRGSVIRVEHMERDLNTALSLLGTTILGGFLFGALLEIMEILC